MNLWVNILRRLTQEGARVVVIPPENAQRTIEQIKPSAIFLSNGPGDPQRVVEGIRLVRAYMEKLPIMGICLGHQIIGLALDLRTGRIHITAQNHNFAVEPESLKDVELTHINLLDQTLEGFRHKYMPIYCVQFHPEASPGPHDAFDVFKEFISLACQTQ
jgi:carbamoyl-phosphate synthase small subunit